MDTHEGEGAPSRSERHPTADTSAGVNIATNPGRNGRVQDMVHADLLRAHEFIERTTAWVNVRASDDIQRTIILGHGYEWFKHAFTKEFRGFGALCNEQAIRGAFAWLCEKHLQVFADASPADILDNLEVPTPPTAEEIARAWTIESASSEEGRRALYGDEHPQQVLDRLVAEDRDAGRA